MADTSRFGPSPDRWTEDDSVALIDAADVFVPARVEQVATARGLIPASTDDTFT